VWSTAPEQFEKANPVPKVEPPASLFDLSTSSVGFGWLSISHGVEAHLLAPGVGEMQMRAAGLAVLLGTELADALTL
jgi:hypothetical protein